MNTLFLISGPSGSGKTTIMRNVMQNEIVSFTTRAKRPGEVDDVDYHFITEEQFNDLQASDGLIESSTYSGNHYGVTRQELYTKTAKGHAFAIVDGPGKIVLQSLYVKCVSIFIYASTFDVVDNLRDRGESDAFVKTRMSTWLKEWRGRVMYQYVVRNVRGRLNDSIEIVRHIVNAETNA